MDKKNNCINFLIVVDDAQHEQICKKKKKRWTIINISSFVVVLLLISQFSIFNMSFPLSAPCFSDFMNFLEQFSEKKGGEGNQKNVKNEGKSRAE